MRKQSGQEILEDHESGRFKKRTTDDWASLPSGAGHQGFISKMLEEPIMITRPEQILEKHSPLSEFRSRFDSQAGLGSSGGRGHLLSEANPLIRTQRDESCKLTGKMLGAVMRYAGILSFPNSDQSTRGICWSSPFIGLSMRVLVIFHSPPSFCHVISQREAKWLPPVVEVPTVPFARK